MMVENNMEWNLKQNSEKEIVKAHTENTHCPSVLNIEGIC